MTKSERAELDYLRNFFFKDTQAIEDHAIKEAVRYAHLTEGTKSLEMSTVYWQLSTHFFRFAHLLELERTE